MAGNVTDAWFAAHTAGAPDALQARVREFYGAAHGATEAARLSAAAGRALERAAGAAGARSAALDLLAADALITLALLELATRSPSTLATDARALRHTLAAA